MRSTTLIKKARAESPTRSRSAEHFAAGERFVVILGDNIIQDDIAPYLEI